MLPLRIAGAAMALALLAAGPPFAHAFAAESQVIERPETFQEQWQERVAIMAVDGGVPEAEAQRLSWRHLQAAATPPGSITHLDTL